MDANTDWEVTTNRYIGFIDIMGFKNMVSRFPHAEIYELMKKLDQQLKHAQSITWPGLASNLVQTTTFSDSIILYSKNDAYESLDALISSIATLTSYLFLEGIPHKGALAFGTMTLDSKNSIFFGQPLIDAYILQDEILFYGILIHSTVEKEILKNNFNIPVFVKNYACKLKGGTAKHLTIYPIHTKENLKDNKEKSIKLFQSVSRLRLNTSGSIRK